METFFDETQNYIYYLQLSNELPEYFFKLSWAFKKYWNISLIPITPYELVKIRDRSRMFVLSVCENPTAQETLIRFREIYLDLALLSGKVCFFDVSHGAPIKIAHKLEKSKAYYYFSLPITIKELVKNIVVSYYKEKELVGAWPWGRRAKLPAH